VRGARIQEGQEALALDGGGDDHRVLRRNTRHDVQGDHEGVGERVDRDGLLLPDGDPGIRRAALVINVVARLEVEELLALVTADEGFVAVVA
jgi:hypothetical protein